MTRLRAALAVLLVSPAFTQTGSLKDGGLHVVICGSGSPLPDPQRASACVAVLAGNDYLLFDVGPGSWRKAGFAQLTPAKLTGILLTHFHSDHIGDLGEAITMSWTGGRPKPLDVFGPPGVEKVVDGFLAAYRQDSAYRTAHHSEELLPAAAWMAIARPIEPNHLAIDRDGLRVTAFPVAHDPVRPAYGYRIEYHGRKVVITGDTGKSADVEKQAAGADLLIHDSLSKDMILAGAKTLEALGQTRQAKMARDIVTYHASPLEAAQIAAAAKADTLVLTHIVPVLRNELMEKQFLAGVAEAFGGKVVLAKDGMRFDLPAKPESK